MQQCTKIGARFYGEDRQMP